MSLGCPIILEGLLWLLLTSLSNTISAERSRLVRGSLRLYFMSWFCITALFLSVFLMSLSFWELKWLWTLLRETAHNYSCQHPEGKTINRSPLTLFSVKVPPCHSHLLASDRGTSNSCSMVGGNTNRVKNPELSFYKLVNQKNEQRQKWIQAMRCEVSAERMGKQSLFN